EREPRDEVKVETRVYLGKKLLNPRPEHPFTSISLHRAAHLSAGYHGVPGKSQRVRYHHQNHQSVRVGFTRPSDCLYLLRTL
ncbi:MAG: hypothetical protein VB029_04565, partial [Anaerolineaceae bacterium]|nr:hypothetical protein [Anaerolineaceae bacterium]